MQRLGMSPAAPWLSNALWTTSHSCSWGGPGGVVRYRFKSIHDTSQWQLSWRGGLSSWKMWAVQLSPLEHSTKLHLNVQIKSFLPASALGSQLREERLPFLGKHAVWLLTELTVIYFSASSTSCTSPFGNIEERVEGKRKGLVCTYTVCDILSMQDLVWWDVSTTSYVLVKTLLVLQVGEGRKPLKCLSQAWAKALMSLCTDFLFPILSDEGRKGKEKQVLLLSSGMFSSCFTGSWINAGCAWKTKHFCK